MHLQQHHEPLAVKLKEAAAMLGVSVPSLRRKIKSGDLKAVMAFRHLTISVKEIHAFLARNTTS